MSDNKPEPVCKAFLVCRQVATDPQSGEAVLVGLPMDYSQRRFPAAAMVGFFARLTDARGSYEVEIQLRNADGDVVWADALPRTLDADDPLMYYDLRLNLNVVFPGPGDYEFTLALGGDVVAQQRFKVLQASKQPSA
jgi:hypothetical protein